MFDVTKYTFVLVYHYIGIGVVVLFLRYLFPLYFSYLSFLIGYFIFFMLALLSSFNFVKEHFLKDVLPVKNKAVFITGCDTGFGHQLAKQLDSKGFLVFAGCLYPSTGGAQQLQSYSSNRLKIVKLDVTEDGSVLKAFEYVKDNLNDSKLWAIVNNAGITSGNFFDLCSMDDFYKCMEVNCLGIVRVTKTFLPLLKDTKGRLINVTSYNGRLTSQGKVPYVCSKFAASGLSDSLRLELDVWGIKVISIEPHVFQTPMTSSKSLKARDSLDIEKLTAHGATHFEELKKAFKMQDSLRSPKTWLVINALESAVCSVYPKAVYRVMPDKTTDWFYTLYDILPLWLQDEIVKNGYSYFPKPSL